MFLDPETRIILGFVFAIVGVIFSIVGLVNRNKRTSILKKHGKDQSMWSSNIKKEYENITVRPFLISGPILLVLGIVVLVYMFKFQS
jgi:hypothetical protein